MKITYLGTTTLLFDDGKDQILFDCHITRPSLLTCFLGRFGTDRAIADRVIRECAIDRLKAVFISHTHHDHVMDAPYFLQQCGGDLYGSASARNVALGGRIDEERIHCYADNMEYRVGDFAVRVIPSVHSIAHWYNNDLGQTIDTPLIQPAKKSAYKEGGSFDFLVKHGSRTYLIRPSCNYLVGQLDDIRADVLFLGIGGLSREQKERKAQFFNETVDKVHPEIVIPVHWDNFFTPLFDETKWCTGVLDNPENSIQEARSHCEANGIRFIHQMPLQCLEV